jgi:hypothetical protein
MLLTARHLCLSLVSVFVLLPHTLYGQFEAHNFTAKVTNDRVLYFESFHVAGDSITIHGETLPLSDILKFEYREENALPYIVGACIGIGIGLWGSSELTAFNPNIDNSSVTAVSAAFGAGIGIILGSRIAHLSSKRRLDFLLSTVDEKRKVLSKIEANMSRSQNTDNSVVFVSKDIEIDQQTGLKPADYVAVFAGAALPLGQFGEPALSAANTGVTFGIRALVPITKRLDGFVSGYYTRHSQNELAARGTALPDSITFRTGSWNTMWGFVGVRYRIPFPLMQRSDFFITASAGFLRSGSPEQTFQTASDIDIYRAVATGGATSLSAGLLIRKRFLIETVWLYSGAPTFESVTGSSSIRSKTFVQPLTTLTLTVGIAL